MRRALQIEATHDNRAAMKINVLELVTAIDQVIRTYYETVFHPKFHKGENLPHQANSHVILTAMLVDVPEDQYDAKAHSVRRHYKPGKRDRYAQLCFLHFFSALLKEAGVQELKPGDKHWDDLLKFVLDLNELMTSTSKERVILCSYQFPQAEIDTLGRNQHFFGMLGRKKRSNLVTLIEQHLFSENLLAPIRVTLYDAIKKEERVRLQADIHQNNYLNPDQLQSDKSKKDRVLQILTIQYPQRTDPALPRIDEKVILGDEKIASGGFGCVYLRNWFRGENDRVTVAVKMVGATSGGRKCSVRESQIYYNNEISVLTHFRENFSPYIVECHGYISNYGIVMEYADKGSVLSAIYPYGTQKGKKPSDPYKPTIRFRWIVEIMKGVDALHAAGFLSRDVSLGNVLLFTSGATEAEQTVHAKLCDFGFSVKHKDGEYPGRYMLGKPAYLAPELCWVHPPFGAKRYPYSTKTDIYAAAIVGVEIVHWEIAFHDVKTVQKVIAKTLAGKRPALPEGCGEQLGNLLTRMFTAEPNDRPSTEQVIQELEAMEPEEELQHTHG